MINLVISLDTPDLIVSRMDGCFIRGGKDNKSTLELPIHGNPVQKK